MIAWIIFSFIFGFLMGTALAWEKSPKTWWMEQKVRQNELKLRLRSFDKNEELRNRNN